MQARFKGFALNKQNHRIGVSFTAVDVETSLKAIKNTLYMYLEAKAKGNGSDINKIKSSALRRLDFDINIWPQSWCLMFSVFIISV